MEKSWRQTLESNSFAFTKVLPGSPMGGPIELWTCEDFRGSYEVVIRYDIMGGTPSVMINCVLCDSDIYTVYGQKELQFPDQLEVVVEYTHKLLKGRVEPNTDEMPEFHRVYLGDTRS